MGAGTIFLILTAVLNVIYCLDLTKTSSYYNKQEVVQSNGLSDFPNEVVDTSSVTKSATTLTNQDGILYSLTNDPTKIVNEGYTVEKLMKRDSIVGSLLENPTEVINAASETKSTNTLVKNDGIVSIMPNSPIKVLSDNPVLSNLGKRCYESQQISCSSDIEEKESITLSSKQCESSSTKIESDVVESRNSENNVAYQSSYQSSGGKEVESDHVDVMKNQRTACSSDFEKEKSISSNSKQCESSSTKIKSDVESRKLGENTAYQSSHKSSGGKAVMVDNKHKGASLNCKDCSMKNMHGPCPKNPCPCPHKPGPCSEKHCPSTPKHIPDPEKHLPCPGKHCPSTPKHIKCPEKHCPSTPKHKPCPEKHCPSTPKHIPCSGKHLPCPGKHSSPQNHPPCPPKHSKCHEKHSSCSGNSGMKKTEITENQRKACKSDIEKEKSIKLNSKQCELSGTKINKDVVKSRNLGENVDYQSSHHLSGGKALVVDNVNKNQRTTCTTDIEKEKSISSNSKQCELSGTKINKDVVESRNLGENVDYQSSHHLSGGKTLVVDNENQRTTCATDIEKEKSISTSSKQCESSSTKIESEVDESRKLQENIAYQSSSGKALVVDNENRKAICTSDIEKEKSITLNSKQCESSDIKIQSDVETRNLKENVDYQSSYKSTEGKAVEVDDVNVMTNQQTSCTSDIETEQSITLNEQEEISSSSSQSSSYTSSSEQYENQVVEGSETIVSSSSK